MSDEELAQVGDIEIEPLTDSDLESAAAGVNGTSNCLTTLTCPSTTGCPPQTEQSGI
jgi:hypothetical protein